MTTVSEVAPDVFGLLEQQIARTKIFRHPRQVLERARPSAPRNRIESSTAALCHWTFVASSVFADLFQ